MNLGEIQRMTARLTTEAPLLARFLADPESTAAAEGWSIETARELHAVSGAGLRRYGESLVRKRAGEAARCLPLSRRALGAETFRDLFRKHAQQTATVGINRHPGDAIAFADGIASGGAAAHAVPAWVVDVLRLEAAALRAWAPDRRLVVLPLGRHPADLEHAIATDHPPARSPCLVVWYRFGPGRPRRLVLGLRQKS